MRMYVMVDMEGISGIYANEQVELDKPEGRRLTTQEVNACVQGCIDGGATEIIVKDAHGIGKNFYWHELHEGARYVVGNGDQEGNGRMPGVEGFDGLILLGYHAMAGTAEAVLEHTWSADIQEYIVNGAPTGEIGADTYYAAHFSVPTVMVSGDDKACKEAEALQPGVVTAVVKESHALHGATFLPPDAAHALVREKAAEATRRCKEFTVPKLSLPVTIQMRFRERQPLPIVRDSPYMRVVDGHTFEVTADNFLEGYFRTLELY